MEGDLALHRERPEEGEMRECVETVQMFQKTGEGWKWIEGGMKPCCSDQLESRPEQPCLGEGR